jgi:hypothetical protein
MPGSGWFGATPDHIRATSPIYRFECPAGCAPLPFFGCRAMLHSAILAACQLALRTAHGLEVNPPDATIAGHFRVFFGHDPAQPFPGTLNIASRDCAACQFKSIEDASRRSNTLYRCDPCTGIRQEPPASSILDAHAIAIPARNEVLLCPTFWSLPPILQAGVVLHEMLHLRFAPFFRHDATERRQNSAYCYEAFALSAAGHRPDPLAIAKCQAAPIA